MPTNNSLGILSVSGAVVVVSMLLASCKPALPSTTSAIVMVFPPNFNAAPVLLSEVNDLGPLESICAFDNNGSGSAEIKLDRVSCGCLGISLVDEDKELKSGDLFTVGSERRTELRMKFRPSSRAGVHSQSAEFLSSVNGRTTRHTVSAQISVIEDVIVSPPVISQSFTPHNMQPVKRTLRIDRTVRGSDASALKPEIRGDASQVELVEIAQHKVTQIGPELWTSSWDATVLVNPPDANQATLAGNNLVVFPNQQVRVPVTITFSP